MRFRDDECARHEVDTVVKRNALHRSQFAGAFDSAMGRPETGVNGRLLMQPAIGPRLHHRSERVCTHCERREANAACEALVPYYVCTDCRRLTETEVLQDLTPRQARIVRHAAKLFRDTQRHHVAKRGQRAHARDKAGAPTTADEYISSRVFCWRTQITLLDRTVAIAKLRGWHEPNQYEHANQKGA